MYGAKVKMKPYTTVLILKLFKNPSICRSMASSGIRKNLPRKEWTICALIGVWNWETGNNTQWPLTIATWFQCPHSEDGKSSFKFYKRIAKKPLFVHHQSVISEKSKINFIRNERNVLKINALQKQQPTKHQNMFDDVLHLNGYPESTIDKT